VFLVLAHDRRRILHFGVTSHPTAEWTAQQLREAFPWDTAPRYLLRDRDRIFGADLVTQVKAMGIQQVLSAPRSPWQRAYIERVIGTLRRECLDHVIVFSEASLYRHLSEDSWTTIIGAARISACRRTRQSHAQSKRQKPGESSRSPRWVGFIIGTNVAPLEPTTAAS
jgi:transposase InsO family protein